MNLNRDYRKVLTTGRRSDRLYRACLLREQNQVNGPVVGVCIVLAAIIMLLAMVGCAVAETEQEVIASVIAGEACGEGAFGMELVSHVINNRAKTWNKTPYQVVTQKNQFYAYTAKNRATLYKQCQSASNSLANALLSDDMGSNDPTHGGLYFRQPGEKIMAWHKTETFRYKNHIFYK